jgi:antitoxin component YwqK of YwqJK toxin-antitoxin module
MRAVLLFFMLPIFVFPVTTTVIFIDENCKQVESFEKAAYYREISFDDKGTIINPVKDYYLSGKLRWRGNIDPHTKDFTNTTYFGLCTWYYENGQKKQEGNYDNDLPNGVILSWYEDGTPKCYKSFIHGVLSGTVRYYHENGQIYYNVLYHAGERVGEEVFYFPDGTLAARNVYNSGTRIEPCFQILDIETSSLRVNCLEEQRSNDERLTALLLQVN